jgi:hypothetical protein
VPLSLGATPRDREGVPQSHGTPGRILGAALLRLPDGVRIRIYGIPLHTSDVTVRPVTEADWALRHQI